MNYKKKFSEFIKNIDKKDRIAIFHDIDGDGLCATALLTKALHRLGLKANLSIGKGREEIGISDETIKDLVHKRITKLFILDKPSDIDTHSLKKIENFADIVIIDHHPVWNNVASKKTFFIKSKFLAPKRHPTRYCTSEMVYNLFQKIVFIEDLDWIAFCGALSDVAAGSAFTKKILNKYNLSGDPWTTPLGKVIHYISHASVYNPRMRIYSLKVLTRSDRYYEVLRSNLKRYYEIVDKEIKKYIDNFENDAEFVNDIAFYKIKPKYKINSILLTILSIEHYPDRTLILITDGVKGMYRISLRRHDEKKNVRTLIEKATKGLKNAGGGGHPAASGGSVQKKDFEKLKKRIIKLNSTI